MVSSPALHENTVDSPKPIISSAQFSTFYRIQTNRLALCSFRRAKLTMVSQYRLSADDRTGIRLQPCCFELIELSLRCHECSLFFSIWRSVFKISFGVSPSKSHMFTHVHSFVYKVTQSVHTDYPPLAVADSLKYFHHDYSHS